MQIGIILIRNRLMLLLTFLNILSTWIVFMKCDQTMLCDMHSELVFLLTCLNQICIYANIRTNKGKQTGAFQFLYKWYACPIKKTLIISQFVNFLIQRIECIENIVVCKTFQICQKVINIPTCAADRF